MKKTSRPSKRPQSSVLQVRVMSPRIAWFGFLRIFGRCMKYALIAGMVGAAGWGAWKGIRHAFHENPDFRLQTVDLNENSAIDEFGVYQIADIDPQVNLFTLDIDQVAERLRGVPALSAVQVERRLPGTLHVRVLSRVPCAWAAVGNEPFERKPGGLLIDHDGHAFPCTTVQFETAEKLPVILLPGGGEHGITSGKTVDHPELARCMRLLDAATKADPGSIARIESLRQANSWSLELVTRDGLAATFGLGDHERQISNFRAAIDHASRGNYSIATINLIPKINVPVTLRGSAPPPKALIVPEPTADDVRRDRRSRDLNTLLNSR
ncbi:MAG: FtsQ-type POTRA domain-containing protein [Akkermansiaceae bacterium]|nr:FtsQ-type POTRA domain-containing protein [Akkermansiaceae bacterium]